MKPERLEKYRQTLLDWRDRLTEQIDHLEQSIAEETNTPGMVSNLPTHNADQDSEGLTRDVALGQNETEMLSDIVAALERIDDGTFGECTHCGQTIAKARLDAIPYTSHCRECQEQFEKEAEASRLV